VGCGGSTKPKPASASAYTAWAAQTQRLCVQKRAAITRLGSVHITYAAIKQVGLPAVKRTLEGYVTRLLAVLRTFSQRQQRLTPPAPLVSTMAAANAVDRASHDATIGLQQAIAHSSTAAQLSAAFKSWLGKLQGLAARGDSLARQLNLPKCESSAAG
jgi:hypothetical protein